MGGGGWLQEEEEGRAPAEGAEGHSCRARSPWEPTIAGEDRVAPERGQEAASRCTSPGQAPGQRNQPLEGGPGELRRGQEESSETDRQELAELLAQPGARDHLTCSTPS